MRVGVTSIDCPQMAVPELLDALLRAHGPSGHEQLAYGVVRDAVDGIAEVESDTAGNLVVRRPGASAAPLLGIFAHLDVIGLAVAHIRDTGMLSVHKLAPSQPAVAWGQRVEIRTRAGMVPGVVARASKEAEKIEWDELFVDIGASPSTATMDDAPSKVKNTFAALPDVRPSYGSSCRGLNRTTSADHKPKRNPWSTTNALMPR